MSLRTSALQVPGELALVMCFVCSYYLSVEPRRFLLKTHERKT